MIISNPFEAYVFPHMMPSVGLASGDGDGQREQLWVSDATTLQDSDFLSPYPYVFTSGGTGNTFYAEIPYESTDTGSGEGGLGYPFYQALENKYPTALDFIKSKDDSVHAKIGLNLGHRTYFPMVRQNIPRCQAEGCMTDLSAAKQYHRRHKVCEYHSKASVVVAAGLQQRFCQQCSRFHVLSEFDETKRSCRKRLADHNSRRRKPQTPPLASTNCSVRPRSNIMKKRKETSVKPTRGTATSKENIVHNTTTGSRTIYTPTNQTNMSAESPEQYQKRASPLRPGPALSLVGTEGEDKGNFGFNSSYWAATSYDNRGLVEQQQQHIVSSPSSSTFFRHNFLLRLPRPTSNVQYGGCDQAHDQNNLMHHGQGIFEAECFI